MGWLEAALRTQSILGPLWPDCDTSLWALASWIQRHICQRVRKKTKFSSILVISKIEIDKNKK